MRRMGRVLVAISLLIPTPALMKSCGGSGMGHMQAGTANAMAAQAYVAREARPS